MDQDVPLLGAKVDKRRLSGKARAQKQVRLMSDNSVLIEKSLSP